jgi:hypothetical protein
VYFCQWPCDFYNYTADFYVQVDDKHHLTGIHQYSKQDIAAKDMRFNRAAAQAGKTVVRVARADLQNPASVLAALAAARGGAAFVLTPSYATHKIGWQGQDLQYEDALKECALSAGVQFVSTHIYAGCIEFKTV